LSASALHKSGWTRVGGLGPEFSRSYLQQLIEQGGVSAKRQARDQGIGAAEGWRRGEIELRPTPQSQAFKPEPMALDVVYEDEHLLVINKPAGLVVHPCTRQLERHPAQRPAGAATSARVLPRAGIVHRLDKDTSGLMVVARSRRHGCPGAHDRRSVKSAASTWRWPTARGWVPRGAR
jgi:23S rRNA pseudouridine1911/1915/1917 synthase